MKNKGNMPVGGFDRMMAQPAANPPRAVKRFVERETHERRRELGELWQHTAAGFLRGYSSFGLERAEPGPSVAPPGAEPDQRQAALLAGRQPIGIWQLMLWAYGKEMVRFTCGTNFRLIGPEHSSMAWAMAAGQAGAVGSGCDTGLSANPCCHDDALLVHGVVLDVIAAERNAGINDNGEAGRQAFELLVKQAEAAASPTWDVPAPVWRVVPVRRKNGKVKHLFNARNVAYACEVTCVGEIAALGLLVHSHDDYRRIVDAAEARYSQWVRLLHRVIHMLMPNHERLKRWRLNGLGVEPVPWER